jgi:hypothetical protein
MSSTSTSPTHQIKPRREDHRKMVRPTNRPSLLRALNTEEGNREVLMIEQFQAAIESNPVEMFNILNKELAMNKAIITQLNMQTEDLQAQLNTETVVLELVNKQMADLLNEQTELNTYITKLLIMRGQQGRPSSEQTVKMLDLLVLTDRKDLKFED